MRAHTRPSISGWRECNENGENGEDRERSFSRDGNVNELLEEREAENAYNNWELTK